jgi:hypothetical protein
MTIELVAPAVVVSPMHTEFMAFRLFPANLPIEIARDAREFPASRPRFRMDVVSTLIPEAAEYKFPPTVRSPGAAIELVTEMSLTKAVVLFRRAIVAFPMFAVLETTAFAVMTFDNMFEYVAADREKLPSLSIDLGMLNILHA